MIAGPRLVLFMLLFAALGLSAPAEARTWKEVYPLQKYRTYTIASEGVTVTVTPPVYDDEADDAEESFRESYNDATIDVQFPGLPLFRVPEDAFRSSPYGIRVGIGKLGRRDAQPTVLLAGYSGGAHCCATLQVVSVMDGQPVVENLPLMDGEPMDKFPRDVDGDGTADIRWGDDSLLYQFSSHAGSWQVPRIYDIRGGKAVDVSREPGFARVYRDFAAQTLKWCRKGEGNNGACAAHAYAMANLGRAEEGIRAATGLADDSTWLPEDCSVEYTDDGCPEGQAITFDSFEPALRYVMHKNGYLP